MESELPMESQMEFLQSMSLRDFGSESLFWTPSSLGQVFFCFSEQQATSLEGFFFSRLGFICTG